MSRLNEELRFAPNLFSPIWGGTAIPEYKGISVDLPNVGESWEVSAVPGKESVVTGGRFDGRKLTDLVEEFGSELLGTRVYERYGGKFPLLVKIIDTDRDLSIQVHPDDDLAMKRHNSCGKTEMWYIIGSRHGARIKVGVNAVIDPQEYERRIADSTIEDVISSYESHPGDCYFVPAGSIHAIGAGNLLVEVQQSSDITYRIFDYNRKDKDGNLRQLHTELAKDAINYLPHSDYHNSPKRKSESEEELVACDYFIVDRIRLNGKMELKNNGESFNVVICVEGELTIDTGWGPRRIQRGTTVLLPACLTSVTLCGNATLLTSRC